MFSRPQQRLGERSRRAGPVGRIPARPHAGPAVSGNRRPFTGEPYSPPRSVRADTRLDDRIDIVAVDQRQSKQVKDRAAGRQLELTAGPLELRVVLACAAILGGRESRPPCRTLTSHSAAMSCWRQ